MGAFIAILGMLSTKLGTAYDYFFGSSVGSANKELMIDEARRGGGR